MALAVIMRSCGIFVEISLDFPIRIAEYIGIMKTRIDNLIKINSEKSPTIAVLARLASLRNSIRVIFRSTQPGLIFLNILPLAGSRSNDSRDPHFLKGNRHGSLSSNCKRAGLCGGCGGICPVYDPGMEKFMSGGVARKFTFTAESVSRSKAAPASRHFLSRSPVPRLLAVGGSRGYFTSEEFRLYGKDSVDAEASKGGGGKPRPEATRKQSAMHSLFSASGVTKSGEIPARLFAGFYKLRRAGRWDDGQGRGQTETECSFLTCAKCLGHSLHFSIKHDAGGSRPVLFF